MKVNYFINNNIKITSAFSKIRSVFQVALRNSGDIPPVAEMGNLRGRGGDFFYLLMEI